MAEAREPRTPGTDDQMAHARPAGAKVAKAYESFGIFGRMYYQYTVMTGIYMLGAVETWILHLAYLLGVYFTYKYFYAFCMAFTAAKAASSVGGK
jgi:hypothetical protein